MKIGHQALNERLMTLTEEIMHKHKVYLGDVIPFVLEGGLLVCVALLPDPEMPGGMLVIPKIMPIPVTMLPYEYDPNDLSVEQQVVRQSSLVGENGLPLQITGGT
ncbi:MAG TPA: hypothetical protein VEI97_20440 [bacterium]|nr:hypothetical protein [bacterium]